MQTLAGLASVLVSPLQAAPEVKPSLAPRPIYFQRDIAMRIRVPLRNRVPGPLQIFGQKRGLPAAPTFLIPGAHRLTISTSSLRLLTLPGGAPFLEYNSGACAPPPVGHALMWIKDVLGWWIVKGIASGSLLGADIDVVFTPQSVGASWKVLTSAT